MHLLVRTDCAIQYAQSRTFTQGQQERLCYLRNFQQFLRRNAGNFIDREEPRVDQGGSHPLVDVE